MRKLICFILMSSSLASLFSQQVYLEMGKTISSFDYKNSDGNTLDNLRGSTHNYMKLGYHSNFLVQQLNYLVGVSFNGYGASGSDDKLGNYYDWDISYLGLDLGIDYELFKKRYTTNNLSDFSFYLKASVSPEIPIYGTQTINHKEYSIIGTEQFKYPFLFVRGGLGIRYSITSSITAYLQYMGGKGFPLKFGDSEDKEKLRILGHNFGFGLFFGLPSY